MLSTLGSENGKIFYGCTWAKHSIAVGVEEKNSVWVIWTDCSLHTV